MYIYIYIYTGRADGPRAGAAGPAAGEGPSRNIITINM